MTFTQSDFEIRCEWGEHGISVLAPISDLVIIVDVLSFSTCVEIATSRGVVVFPYRGQEVTDFGRAGSSAPWTGAEFAGFQRSASRYSLSPQSLTTIPEGMQLVLASRNGSVLSLATGATPTLAGCLRNARAVAFSAQRSGRRIAIIPAGERWRSDNSLRPCFEDLIGAGAIINRLTGSLSPEAQVALVAFKAARSQLNDLLLRCGSGKELVEKGFAQDVLLAGELNVSDCVPKLIHGGYMAVSNAGHSE
jgi:2-phosphosulfolactate phosphatase